MLPPKDRLRPILSLAVPIMGGMVSQNVMNLVDTAMVGTLGKESLAAVGIASFATFLSQAFLLGLSSGVQAMASRRKGEGNESEMALPLNGGLLLAVTMGVPLSLLLYALAPRLFPFLNDDPLVVAEAVPYWRVRLLAVTAVACNFSFRGYWNGVNLSRLYLRTLVVMHVVNLTLNYLLIFGKLGFPALGATGAGIGTTIATYVGTGTYVFLGLLHARRSGFLRGIPDAATLKTMLRLSVPNGVQQLFFAGSMTALFWIVGQVGTAELAAANVLINVMLVGILPGLGLGLAAASLVGQAMGRGEPADAERWGWDVVRVGLVVVGLIGVPMMLFPERILMVFLHDDASTIELATLPLRIAGAALVFDATGLVLQNALLGAGDSRRVAVLATSMQWLVLLPACYLAGPVLKFGLLGIWLVQVGQRVLSSAVFASVWKAGRWQRIEV